MNRQITQALEALEAAAEEIEALHTWISNTAASAIIRKHIAALSSADHPAPQAESGALTMAEGIGKHGVVKQWPDVAASEPVAMTLKAKAFDWLLANCLVEDDGGWLRLVFETSRQRENHLPDCAKWVASDIAYAAGLDGDAINEVSTLHNGLTEAQTSATASVAGLSGEREALTDEQIAKLCPRLDYLRHYWIKGFKGEPLGAGSESQLVAWHDGKQARAALSQGGGA